MSSHWPTAAEACLVGTSTGFLPRRSLPTPMPIAPEETRITSLPAFLRSLSTLHSASICRMLSRPVGWVMVEVPILMTMRMALSFFRWFLEWSIAHAPEDDKCRF